MRRALTALGVAVILALQFVVPAWGLISDNLSRFTWQMYATGRAQTEFRVNTPSGQIVLSLTDVGGHRVEVDYARLTPPQICARTEATSVEIWTSDVLDEVVECP